MTYSVCLTIIKLMYKVNGFIWLYNAIKDYITLAIFHTVTYSTLLDVYILFIIEHLLSIMSSKKKYNPWHMHIYKNKQAIQCVQTIF